MLQNTKCRNTHRLQKLFLIFKMTILPCIIIFLLHFVKNIKLVIAYDGTHYLGWQKTPKGPSIEEALEIVLKRIFQHPVTLQAASRTDAGVHANGQVVNFFTEKDQIQFDCLQVSLNQLLPPDIVVLKAEEEVLAFHPTLDCKCKEYHYFICKDHVQMPEHRLYSWHCPRLDFLSEMLQASKIFVGKHDFSAFCNLKKQQNYESYVREILSVEVEPHTQERWVIKIRGSNFLYKMVRNIVGTLVYVGRGKITLDQVPQILASHDRRLAGITAPAHGLYLHQVFY